MSVNNLILVDLFDNQIGYGEKLDVHKKGLLHRAFSVFIIHNEKMLLQKRNINKYHSGGLWTNACCSHPRDGEDLELAVYRRLKEELGISTQVNKTFEFVYRAKFENGITEYEYDHVFVADYCGTIYPNSDEISETRWISFAALGNELMNNPDNFTTWFLISAPKVLSLLNREI